MSTVSKACISESIEVDGAPEGQKCSCFYGNQRKSLSKSPPVEAVTEVRECSHLFLSEWSRQVVRVVHVKRAGFEVQLSQSRVESSCPR